MKRKRICALSVFLINPHNLHLQAIVNTHMEEAAAILGAEDFDWLDCDFGGGTKGTKRL